MGFTEGFNVGYHAGSDFGTKVKAGYNQRKISGISEAKQEVNDGSNPSIIDQVKNGVGSLLGQKQEAQPTKEKPVYSFLDQKRETPFSESEMEIMKSKGLSDAYRGMGDERSAALADEKLKQQLKQKDADALLPHLTVFKKATDFQGKMQAYNQQAQQYQQQIQSGANPATLQAPQKPIMENITHGESLLDHAYLMAFNQKHDPKFDLAKETTALNDKIKQTHDENYIKGLRLAHSGADINQIAKVFNETGDIKMDAAHIVSDRYVKMPDGMQTRVISVKNEDGTVTDLNTAAELSALGKAGELAKQFHDQLKSQNEARKTDSQILKDRSIVRKNATAAGVDLARVGEINASKWQHNANIDLINANTGKAEAATDVLKNKATEAKQGKKLGVKDYEEMVRHNLTLDKGDMGLNPDEGKNRQAQLERSTAYAQRHVERQPSIAEVMAAGRIAPGTKKKINGTDAVWDGFGWKSEK